SARAHRSRSHLGRRQPRSIARLRFTRLRATFAVAVIPVMVRMRSPPFPGLVAGGYQLVHLRHEHAEAPPRRHDERVGALEKVTQERANPLLAVLLEQASGVCAVLAAVYLWFLSELLFEQFGIALKNYIYRRVTL